MSALVVPVPRLAWLWGVAIALVVLHFAGAAARMALGDAPEITRFTELVNLDAESNLPTWFGSILLFFAALAARTRGLAARAANEAAIARGYRRLAAILFVLSIDEVATMHERVAAALLDAVKTNGAPPLVVWGIGGAITLALAAALVDLLRRLPRALAARLVLAGGVYVGGALGVESIGHVYARAHGYWTWGYVALAAIEELGEMSGVLLFLGALAPDDD